MRFLTTLLILSTLAPPRTAAQDDPSTADPLVPTDGSDLDPIGVDRDSDLHTLPTAPPEEPARLRDALGPRPPEVSVQDGEVLTAIAGVREIGHRVRVHLRDGLAEVGVEVRLFNRARYPAEVFYRLAVPADAALMGLEVCGGAGGPSSAAARCRPGLPDRSPSGRSAYDDAVRAWAPLDTPAPAPIAHAALEPGAPAHVLLRAAPLPRLEEVSLRLRYLTSAPVRGGVARLSLPPRAQDARIAVAHVTATADGLLSPTVDGASAERTPVELDPWHPIEVQAALASEPAPHASIARFPCGDRWCARTRVAAGPRPARPVDLVLAIDASPSTEGPARNRMLPAVAALLAAAPDGSRVRAVAFASEGRAVLERPLAPADAPLSALAPATRADLGSATRFEAAWAVIEPMLRDRRADLPAMVVIVGDGGLSTGAEGDAAFAAARRSRVTVSTLNVADRATWPSLRERVEGARGVVVEAGAQAAEVERSRPMEPLLERVSLLFSPVVLPAIGVRIGGETHSLGPLRAGEELTWEGEAAGRPRWIGLPVALGRAAPGLAALEAGLGVRLARRLGLADPRGTLAAVDATDFDADPPPRPPGRCDPRGPATRASGIPPTLGPVALAAPRVCAPPRAPPSASEAPGRGIPAETVLRMLRQRVVPIARRCFRRDRAGRADYSVRAEYHFELTDREVVRADVVGEIPPPLRACLQQAIDRLDVPRFEGRVVVRYPVYTERDAPPPRVELHDDVAREVDRVLD